MTSKFDRSFASAQRAYDSMEAPEGCECEEGCECRPLTAADRRELAYRRSGVSHFSADYYAGMVDADADDITF